MSMDKTVLKEIVKQCGAQTMSLAVIQFNLARMANFIDKMPIVGQDKNVENEKNVLNIQNVYRVNEIQKLEQKIEGICDEIKKVKQMMQIMQCRIGGFQGQINNVFQKLNACVTRQNKIKDVCKILGTEILKFSHFIAQNKNSTIQCFRHFSDLFNAHEQMINSILTNTNKQKKRKYVIKIDQPVVQLEKTQNGNQLLKEQKWGSKFVFNEGKLTKIHDDKTWYQFVFKEQALKDKFSFKIKIVQLKQKNIMIGVVDYDKQKQQKESSESGNAVCYSAADGCKYPGEIKDGNGMVKGETVEVRVDRNNNTISWVVDNILRASYKDAMIGFVGRRLMPYVEMYNIGDAIEYSLCSQ